jgi:[acyl-carrier-protein] S-malonyltransferase
MSSAILFPGLVPVTYAGLRTFLQTSEHAWRRFAQASAILGYSLADAFARAGQDDWEAIDCAFLAANLAMGDHAAELVDSEPVLIAGMSFGALPAAVYSGALPYPAAVVLVRDSARVQARHLAELPEPEGTYFFCRVSEADVHRLVDQLRAAGHRIEVSAYLGLDVHGVSAPLSVLALFKSMVGTVGGWGFHTMNRPQHCAVNQGFRDELTQTVYARAPFQPADVPLLSDVDGRALVDPGQVCQSLLAGWTEPVRLSATADGLVAQGIERTYVVGPRNMIGRMISDVCAVVPVTPEALLVPAK